MKKACIIILKIGLFFVGWAVLSGVVDIPNDNPAVWRLFAELIPLAILGILTAVFLLLERGTLKIPLTENLAKGTAVGTLTGFIWIGVSVAILFATEQLRITGRNEVPYLFLWIISAFLNVVMQELLVRGYIYQLLKTNYNLPLAIIVTTALFTLMHGGTFEAGIIPVVNVMTMCLFTTAIYESEKTLASPIMAHAVWNIMGAIIIGGVSLAEDYPSLHTLAASDNIILSGGTYKIEGSVVVLCINIVLMLTFFIRYKRKSSKV